ncbi:MAG: type II toxin-antitoxin system VapC family toxin [Alphaproteobacteria bacterium]|nr:type II toxin-antitoxin system VapC family toxin [Alphaproteobacteria bacterium]
MKYLLDTCVLLWALEGNQKKLNKFYELIEDSSNSIFVSVISYWEITIKKALGKLVAPDDLIEIIEQTGFSWLNLDVSHIKELEKLPMLHHDPFDRLLIAQSNATQLKLLTLDEKILNYYTHKQ